MHRGGVEVNVVAEMANQTTAVERGPEGVFAGGVGSSSGTIRLEVIPIRVIDVTTH
jgi:hypothetical protein